MPQHAWPTAGRWRLSEHIVSEAEGSVPGDEISFRDYNWILAIVEVYETKRMYSEYHLHEWIRDSTFIQLFLNGGVGRQWLLGQLRTFRDETACFRVRN
jgi:hypothetical protein